MEHELADAVEFGAFRFEPARRILTRSGSPVRIGDRAFDILKVLIAHAPDVVTKQVLLQEAWAGVFVDETNLRFNMVQLRRALGDGADNNRYIATVVGRGYCFVAPLSRAASAGPGSATVDADPMEDRAAQPELPGTNLPLPLTNILGRDEELVALRDSIGPSRLVTLIGPGGVGKTRLAIELGWNLLGRFPGGVWLVDLAPLVDRAAVISVTAKVLGVTLHNTETAIEAIVAVTGKQQRLLIFDNCEHLVGVAGELIDSMLERVPSLSVLATSQEVLHSRAEHVYHLNPLAVPPPGATEIAGYGAVMLFVTRARAVDRRFALCPGNAAGVTEICRRLDGIPLALEMAAARLLLLGVEGLRKGLDERLRMLRLDAPFGDARHQTLRNLLEWSHGLLDLDDQQVFRRLAVFAGSFSVDAAVAVAGDSGADRWGILDALGRLIDKCLLTVDGGEPPRYRLLETLRLFALEQLERTGEAAATEERHAQYFADLFSYTQERWEATELTGWLDRSSPELDNIRAALDWALRDPPHSRIAIALAAGTALLWSNLGLGADARRYVGRALELIDQDTPRAAAAQLLLRASQFWSNTDRARALALAERSTILYRQLEDDLGRAAVLGTVGGLYAMMGRPVEAKAALLEAYEFLAGSNYEKSLFQVIVHLGILAVNTNQPTEARVWFTKDLEFSRERNNTIRMAGALANLAEAEFALGALDRAVENGIEAVTLLRKTKGRNQLAMTLSNLISYLATQGRLSEARPFAAEALSLIRGSGGFILRLCLDQCALLNAREGRHEAAARLLGFTDRIVAESSGRGPSELETYGLLQQLLAAGLSPENREACAAVGARWSEAQAVDFALDHLTSPDAAE